MLEPLLWGPVIWVVCLVLFTLALFVSAIFIKFKNGWISAICFILLEIFGVIAVVSITNTRIYTDNLHLDKGAVVNCINVTPEGIIVKKRFRKVTVPLLGLKLPEGESKYYSAAKEYILNACISGNLYIHYSSVYKGAVFRGATFNSLNEELLKQGLARADVAAPRQYIRIQREAVKDKRGMWEIASYTPMKTSILQYSVTWFIFINSVCLTVVVTTWLKRLAIRLEQRVNSLKKKKKKTIW